MVSWFLLFAGKMVDIIQFYFRLAKEMVNKLFFTSNVSVGNIILYHKLGDDWIALEQGELNREQTNSCLDCDPPLR
jgi:hypothetical protein